MAFPLTQSDMAPLKGLIVCTAWYFTILSGFYLLYCPILYVMFVNHSLYKKCVDNLFSLWELYPVGLFQCCLNTKVNHYGDYLNPDENTIILINHRTRVDWNYIWLAIYHASNNHAGPDEVQNRRTSFMKDLFTGEAKTKFVLKDELKCIPGLGWIMQMSYFLYVKRDWREDQRNLHQFIDYTSSLKTRYRIVLFPEGTDLSEENKRKRDVYAAQNKLPLLEEVLYPRVKGFSALCSRLRDEDPGIASVYDVTLAYDTPPQTEMDMLKGRLPQNVYVHFKRYSIDVIPTQEDDLNEWLNDRWREKEISLRLFNQDGNFLEPSANKVPPLRQPKSLSLAYRAFMVWSIIDIIFTYALLTSRIFQFWFLYHSLLFFFVTWKFGGFHNIQYYFLKRFA